MEKIRLIIVCTNCNKPFPIKHSKCPYCKEDNPYKPSGFDIAFIFNKRGMAHEKNNNINMAISNYESAINFNFEGNHPYDRLAILYRKRKDYLNEIRILNRAIHVFTYLKYNSPRGDIMPKLQRFYERKGKAELLLHKLKHKTNTKITERKIYPQNAQKTTKINKF